jgi:hypothetical protein
MGQALTSMVEVGITNNSVEFLRDALGGLSTTASEKLHTVLGAVEDVREAGQAEDSEAMAVVDDGSEAMAVVEEEEGKEEGKEAEVESKRAKIFETPVMRNIMKAAQNMTVERKVEYLATQLDLTSLKLAQRDLVIQSHLNHTLSQSAATPDEELLVHKLVRARGHNPTFIQSLEGKFFEEAERAGLFMHLVSPSIAGTQVHLERGGLARSTSRSWKQNQQNGRGHRVLF